MICAGTGHVVMRVGQENNKWLCDKIINDSPDDKIIYRATSFLLNCAPKQHTPTVTNPLFALVQTETAVNPWGAVLVVGLGTAAAILEGIRVMSASSDPAIKRSELVQRFIGLGLSEVDANDYVASLTPQDVDSILPIDSNALMAARAKFIVDRKDFSDRFGSAFVRLRELEEDLWELSDKLYTQVEGKELTMKLFENTIAPAVVKMRAIDKEVQALKQSFYNEAKDVVWKEDHTAIIRRWAHDEYRAAGRIIQWINMWESRLADGRTADFNPSVLLRPTNALRTLWEQIEISNLAEEASANSVTIRAENIDPSLARLNLSPNDAKALMIILQNLILNGARYHDPFVPPNLRYVVVSARIENGQVIFEIEDNGRGMTPEELSHYGEEGWMSDDIHDVSDRHGIGVESAKRRIEEFGGRLQVESTPAPDANSGTRVRFTIPILARLGFTHVDGKVEIDEKEKTALYNLANSALGGGNSGALDNLHELAKGGWKVSGAVQEILANWDLLSRAYQTKDPQEFGVYFYRLYNVVAGRVVGYMQNPTDMEALETYMRNVIKGPLEILETMFYRRYMEPLELGTRERAEMSALQHDAVSSGQTLVQFAGFLDTEQLGKIRRFTDQIFLLASIANLDSRNVRAFSTGVVLSEAVNGIMFSEPMLINVTLPANLVFAESVNVAQWAYILYELVRNAGKYRDETKPELNITIGWDETRRAFVVEDNGIGIEDVDAVWGAGVREGRAKEVSGRGLGLASIKERVEKLGWRIELKSEVGKWTRFRIYPKDGDVVTN